MKYVYTGAGRNAEVEITLGKVKRLLALPNDKAGLLLLDPPQMADVINVTVTKIHSLGNNGFQSILLWTKGTGTELYATHKRNLPYFLYIVFR